jgi:hypothetical protein
MDSRFTTEKPRPQPSAPTYRPAAQLVQQYQPFPSQPAPPPYNHSEAPAIHVKGEDHGEQARAELARYGLPAHHEAQICIILDVSLSMKNPNNFYNSGKIQLLINKAMAIAIELSSGQEHTVTIFPFGKIAYNPIVIKEDEVGSAVHQVMQQIGGELSNGTNYNLAIEKVRQHYFKTSGALTKASAYAKAPVFAIFVTDGDAREQITEARNQFAWSEHNAIFLKFIALRGQQSNLKFETLNLICNNNKIKPGGMPNKHLVILNDPDELTIHSLFKRYRLWLEEAHEHNILLTDPNINLDVQNPDDAEEIAEKEALEADHGHEDVAGKHGHVGGQAGNSNALFNQRPRPRPGDSLQLHVSGQVPRNQRYSCC